MCFSNITIPNFIYWKDPINYFKEIFESIEDYRKTVFLIFLIKNDSDLLRECGCLKSDINPLASKYKNILLEQNKEYLDHNKHHEESVAERILKK